MELFYCPDIKNENNILDPVESRHCTKVLRKKTGDLIDITDGLGNLYEARLTVQNKQRCSFEILSSKFFNKPGYTIHIAIAPTKNVDRMEWFVEKVVEIGIDKISFIETFFLERKVINLDRMRKKAISAMKQSIRTYLPVISGMIKLDKLLSSVKEEQKFLAHLENSHTRYLTSQALPGKSYLILIGPEGGFSEDEKSIITQKEFLITKIGDYRLRTETAGIVACTVLNEINHP